jgi:putative transposase
MYVQGVSTRKVKAVTEELCGHGFSASVISDATARLDTALAAFAERRLVEPYPYLILDARYERVREAGVIQSQAVLIAIGVDWEGRRQVLGVELANRESRSSWRDFLVGLKRRGLFGVEFVVSDDHQGLKAAIREVLPEAVWQRCYVPFLRNALD